MGNSFLLIVVGLLLFYLVISDKWSCVEGFLACIKGSTAAQTNTSVTAPNTSNTALPQIPATLQSITLPNFALSSNWLNQV